MFSFNLTIIVTPIVTLASSDWSIWPLIGQHVTQILASHWMRNENQIITDTICLNLNHLETIKLLPHSSDPRK